MLNSLNLFIASIVCFFASFVFLKMMNYPEDTKEKCEEALAKEAINYKEGGECHVWDGSQCRKGNFQAGDCVSKGSRLPLFFMVLGGVLLIVSAVMALSGSGSSSKSSKSPSKSSKSPRKSK